MASLEGKNEVVFVSEGMRAGLRVEAYLNLCETETAIAGHDVYHGVIEIVDARGGVDVIVQVLPVPNDAVDAHKGHFELGEAASAVLLAQAKQVIDTLTSPDGKPDATDAEVLRAVWMTAAEMELNQRNAQMGGMLSLLRMISGVSEDGDDDYQDDEDDGGVSPFSNGNPFAGLL